MLNVPGSSQQEIQPLHPASAGLPADKLSSNPDQLSGPHITKNNLNLTTPMAIPSSSFAPSPSPTIRFKTPIASLDQIAVLPTLHTDMIFENSGRPKHRRKIRSHIPSTTSSRRDAAYSRYKATSSHHYGLPVHYDDSLPCREIDEEMPPDYPYETYTDALLFVWEYVRGMQNLAMRWLEQGATKSTP
ncbi:hypothetical protein MMC13_000727 [Lambiella insularis]|nr:hypothetical protein [Lambiella insularis]